MRDVDANSYDEQLLDRYSRLSDQVKQLYVEGKVEESEKKRQEAGCLSRSLPTQRIVYYQVCGGRGYTIGSSGEGVTWRLSESKTIGKLYYLDNDGVDRDDTLETGPDGDMGPWVLRDDDAD